MRLQIKYTIVIGVIVLCSTNIFAKTYNKPLTKTYIQNTEKGTKLIAEQQQTPDGYECIYLDEEKRIRRYLRNYTYPESSFYTVADYDAKGKLKDIRFKIMEPEGYSEYGYAHTINNDSVYCDYHFFSMADFEINEVTGYSNKYPNKVGDYNLSDFWTTESLLNFLQLESIEIPEGSKKVIFGEPKKGDDSYIKAINVNLRRTASLNGELARKENIGTKVKIEQVSSKETIPKFGKNTWYRISIPKMHEDVLMKKGDAFYILGAFLEPTEKEIKE